MNHISDQTIVTVALFALLLLRELVIIKKQVLSVENLKSIQTKYLVCQAPNDLLSNFNKLNINHEFIVEWTFTGLGLNKLN